MKARVLTFIFCALIFFFFGYCMGWQDAVNNQHVDGREKAK